MHDTLVALGALGTLSATCVEQPGRRRRRHERQDEHEGTDPGGARERASTVHATTGNLNNLIGVPLTLLAMPETADVAVVEMGTNQPGEIARLRAIVEPSIVVVTSVAEEHLEGLGDLAGVLREELAATDGVPWRWFPRRSPRSSTRRESRAGRVVSAGLDCRRFSPNAWASAPTAAADSRSTASTMHVPLRGAHNLRNAMLAIAVAREARRVDG